MENTTNLNLKKPDYTDFADIFDINDNMDDIDEAIHDTKNSIATFASSDVADGSATAWTSVAKVNSGETHKSIFAKMSQMFKNIRYLYKLIGTTDISSIGDGTITKGLSSLNDSFKLTGQATNQQAYIGNSDNTFALGIYRDSRNYIQLNVELGDVPAIVIYQCKNGIRTNMGRVNISN